MRSYKRLNATAQYKPDKVTFLHLKWNLCWHWSLAGTLVWNLFRHRRSVWTREWTDPRSLSRFQNETLEKRGAVKKETLHSPTQSQHSSQRFPRHSMHSLQQEQFPSEGRHWHSSCVHTQIHTLAWGISNIHCPLQVNNTVPDSNRDYILVNFKTFLTLFIDPLGETRRIRRYKQEMYPSSINAKSNSRFASCAVTITGQKPLQGSATALCMWCAWYLSKNTHARLQNPEHTVIKTLLDFHSGTEQVQTR